MNESRDLGDPRRNARPVDTMGLRVFWELRHARLRLAIAENDLAWVQELLVTGDIAPDDALVILDETMDNFSGAHP